MKCLVCGSEKIIKRPTRISDFLVEKIWGEREVGKEHKVNLCHCEECSFSFYDRRLTEEESNRLYEGYRGKEYQKIREKHDCWYTEKVNNALNNDRLALEEQRRVISMIANQNIKREIKVALDYGGNEGETFTSQIGTQKKYVYDISDIETKQGIEKVKYYEDLFKYQFDFIMCNMTLEHISYPDQFMKLLYDVGGEETYYYVEVPSENPFESNKFSIWNNIGLLLNPYYSKARLVKTYFQKRNQAYMPMSEHVNFWTPKSIKILMERCGFQVIDVQENYERGVFGKSKVLSILFVKGNQATVKDRIE